MYNLHITITQHVCVKDRAGMALIQHRYHSERLVQAQNVIATWLGQPAVSWQDLPDSCARGTCAREAEDDARAICEHEAQALLGGYAAIHRICKAELVCRLKLIVSKLVAWTAVRLNLPQMLYHVVGSL